MTGGVQPKRRSTVKNERKELHVYIYLRVFVPIYLRITENNTNSDIYRTLK